MKLITCQHEWVRQCRKRYRCNPPKGYWFENAHYPRSEKMGETGTIPLWYPDHIVQGVLQTLEYNYPCIFTRNVDELQVLSEVYPEYVDLYRKAEYVCRSYAGTRGAAAGFASERYRSSPEYLETRRESGLSAWTNKTGAFSEEGVKERMEKRSKPVVIMTPSETLTFPSLSSAARHFGVDRKTISRWRTHCPHGYVIN